MALNAGDMLYYDGTKWVNSSTLVTAAGGTAFQVADSATNTRLYPVVCSHTTSATPAQGFGTGIKFRGQDSGGSADIGLIQCVESGNPPTAGSDSTYFSFQLYNGGTLGEVLRLGSLGSGSAVFVSVPMLGTAVLLQFSFDILTMTDANFTMGSGDYQNPILEIQGTITADRTITMPSAKGSFWFVHNNTASPHNLVFKTVSGANLVTIAFGKRAIIYADGANIVRLTPDT